jgi:tetratricopeptide (TPR) repeat protein
MMAADVGEEPAILPGGRYRLEAEIGRGGLGIVYRAWDRLTQTSVALKRLHPGIGSTVSEGDSESLVLLAREFHAAASLRHPHIIVPIDYGFDADRLPYFTMTLIDAPRPLLPALRALPANAQMRALAQFLSALAYLHRSGIVHRDLKPGNVLLDAADQVRLVDFGVALRLEHAQAASDEIVGTPLYMSPEVLRGGSASPASDLWAVGVMLYELFIGRHPFMTHEGESIGRVMSRIVHDLPDLAPLPPPLVPVVGRLLSPDPDDRYARVETLLPDLYAALDQPYTGVAAPGEYEATLQAAPFTGRREELARLTASLEEGEPGSAFLIGGESGVGKSRLIDEVRIRALVRGWLTVCGHAVEGGGAPYQMWRDPLRRLVLGMESVPEALASVLKAIVPDIDALLERPIPPAPPLDGDARRARLDDAILQVFAGQQQPVLLLLEDVHWAGEDGGMRALHLLLGRRNTLPLMLIASYRTDEAPDLPAALPAMQHIALPRLDADGIARLLGAMIGTAPRSLAERLIAHTEGNAFFLVETLRDAASRYGTLEAIAARGLPDDLLTGGIAALMERRLARIPAQYQPTLDACALIGRQIDLPLLRALAGDTDGFITAVARAAAFDYADGEWRFAHDMLRASVAGRVSDADQRVLHRRIADAIEQVYPDDRGRLPALVQHRMAAGEARAAADRLIEAANVLIETAAYSQAHTLLEAGLGLAAELSDRWLEADVEDRLGMTSYQGGRYADALAHHQRALDLAQALDDDSLRLKAHLGLARTGSRIRDAATVEQHAAHALELATALGDPHSEMLVSAALGLTAFWKGDLESAERLQRRALDLAEQLDRPVVRGTTLTNLGLFAAYRGDMDAAGTYLLHSLQLNREVGNLTNVGGVLINLGWLDMQRGRYAEARAYFNEALATFERIRHQTGVAEAVSNLAMLAKQEGDLAAIREAYQQALSASTIHLEAGSTTAYIWSRAELGEIALAMGDAARAYSHFIEALTLNGENAMRVALVETLCGLGQIALQQSEVEQAARLAGAADALTHDAPEGVVRKNHVVPLLAALNDRAAAPEAALAHGRAADVDALVAELIAGASSR